VLAIGRFLRIALSDLQMTVIYQDMPETIDILTMCEDIFHVRQDGDHALERQLYNELIELYRSPERLIAVTKPKNEATSSSSIAAAEPTTTTTTMTTTTSTTSS